MTFTQHFPTSVHNIQFGFENMSLLSLLHYVIIISLVLADELRVEAVLVLV